MKTNGLQAVTLRDKGWRSLHQTIFVVSLMIVLICSSIPVAGVLAAPARDKSGPIKNLELAWSNKLRTLRGEMAFFNSLHLKPVKFNKLSKQANAEVYLARYRSALRQAQTIMAKHDGFDKNGKVTNENKATKSVQALGVQLGILRNMRKKLAHPGLNP